MQMPPRCADCAYYNPALDWEDDTCGHPRALRTKGPTVTDPRMRFLIRGEGEAPEPETHYACAVMRAVTCGYAGLLFEPRRALGRAGREGGP